MNSSIVLSLCDLTTVMVQPWANAGYECWCVDIQHPAGMTREGNVVMLGADILHWLPPRANYRAVFAFTPCTNLAVSGARWFRDKGLPGLASAIQLVERCRDIAEWSGAPWMIENPVGTLSTYWRKPDDTFNPCDFAGYLEDPASEAYTKKTCLWHGGGLHHASDEAGAPDSRKQDALAATGTGPGEPTKCHASGICPRSL